MEIKFLEGKSDLKLFEHRDAIEKSINSIVELLIRDNLVLDVSSIEKLRLSIIDVSDEEASCISHRTDPYRFLIKLSSNSLLNLREVLAHEMCHVAQMLSGKLQPDGDDVVWDGKKYVLSEIKSSKRPWEQEAMLFAYNFKTRLN